MPVKTREPDWAKISSRSAKEIAEFIVERYKGETNFRLPYQKAIFKLAKAYLREA